MGSEGSRTEQRDKLGADVATMEASAIPEVGLWSWTGLAELSPVGAKGPARLSYCIIPIINQAARGNWCVALG